VLFHPVLCALHPPPPAPANNDCDVAASKGLLDDSNAHLKESSFCFFSSLCFRRLHFSSGWLVDWTRRNALPVAKRTLLILQRQRRTIPNRRAPIKKKLEAGGKSIVPSLKKSQERSTSQPTMQQTPPTHEAQPTGVLRGTPVFVDYGGTMSFQQFDFCYEAADALTVHITIDLDTTSPEMWRAFVDQTRKGDLCSIVASDGGIAIGVDHVDGKVSFRGARADNDSDGCVSITLPVAKCLDTLEACTAAYEAHVAETYARAADDFLSI
jgi:hypothetical protein